MTSKCLPNGIPKILVLVVFGSPGGAWTFQTISNSFILVLNWFWTDFGRTVDGFWIFLGQIWGRVWMIVGEIFKWCFKHLIFVICCLVFDFCCFFGVLGSFDIYPLIFYCLLFAVYCLSFTPLFFKNHAFCFFDEFWLFLDSWFFFNF